MKVLHSFRSKEKVNNRVFFFLSIYNALFIIHFSISGANRQTPTCHMIPSGFWVRKFLHFSSKRIELNPSYLLMVPVWLEEFWKVLSEENYEFSKSSLSSGFQNTQIRSWNSKNSKATSDSSGKAFRILTLKWRTPNALKYDHTPIWEIPTLAILVKNTSKQTSP